MHGTRLPTQPVKQSSFAAVGNMSTLWHVAARLRLCHMPVRLRHATASSDPVARSSIGLYIDAVACEPLGYACMAPLDSLLYRSGPSTHDPGRN